MPYHHLNTFRHLLVLGLAVVIFSACTVKTLYNQLDWVLADYLESYVKLTDEQQATLFEKIDKTLLWHKSSQLPLYVKWLQDFKTDVQGKLTYQQTEQNITQLQLFFRTLRAHAARELSILLPELAGLQRAEIYASMDDKNDEFFNEFIDISREEQLENYIERMQGRFDDWLGSISPEQEAIIKASAQKIKPIAREVLETRLRWQAEFKTIIEAFHDKVTTQKAMHELFVNTEKYRSKKYQKAYQHNQRVLIQTIVDVAGTISKQQQQYLNDKVDNYSRHFTELAEEARAKLASQ